jgi:ribonuclease-3
MLSKDLQHLQELIDYKFKDIKFLTIALTHSSYASEFSLNDYNERMEFLGDSVLGFIVVDNLYKKFPDSSEGELTKLKSQIVSAPNLSVWAKEISLDTFISMGRGQNNKKARNRENLLCDVFEAVVGAIYLDGNIESVRAFISKFLDKQPALKTIDFKSKLQELIQIQTSQLPQYKILKETGPDHNKHFDVAVYVNKECLGKGSGYSKKEAQQIAAAQALEKIKAVDDK